MTLLFYFTATGNTLAVTRQLAENAEDAQCIRLTKKTAAEYAGVRVSGRVVFVYPVYCANAPLIVRSFLRSLDIDPHAYVCCIATHGGQPGIANLEMAEILNEKGICRYHTFDVAMVHNGQFVTDVPPEDEIGRSLAAARERVDEIAARIDRDETNPIPDASVQIDAVRENPMAQMVIFSFDPSEMRKGFFTDGNCTGCEICRRVCPKENISIIGGKPEWGSDCELCFACLQWCPVHTIQYHHLHHGGFTSEDKGRYHNPDIQLEDIYVIP
ncbi:MAG: EFR1 family ferrodoxin [Clostridiales Family XIII bacterium]|nr:EFR1 family ferrodoxin [Clostridiales Family XIII bacterium]